MIYPVEPAPGDGRAYPRLYIVGDILGNVSDPTRGEVVSRVFERDVTRRGTRVYFDTVQVRRPLDDREVLQRRLADTRGVLDQSDMRRVAHADPHTVIVNDSTTSTGEIGWYRLSLAEVLAGKGYDHMGAWHFNTGDIVGNETARRGTSSDREHRPTSAPSHYTLYEVVRGADGWEIPTWVNGGVRARGRRRKRSSTTSPFDLVDHTDPHFAVVTDPAVDERRHLRRPLARRDPRGHAGLPARICRADRRRHGLLPGLDRPRPGADDLPRGHLWDAVPAGQHRAPARSTSPSISPPRPCGQSSRTSRGTATRSTPSRSTRRRARPSRSP